MKRTHFALATALVLACNSSNGGSGSETGTTGNDDGSETSPSSTSSDDTVDTGQPTDCGNDMIDGDEECDGTDLGGLECSDVDENFVGGTLACGATCTLDASGCMLAPGSALVALNEVTSTSIEGAGNNDAIEIHNAGDAAADISGWRLSDDVALPADKTYTFPEGTTIEPGEFLVLLSYDMDTGTGDFPFGISDNSVETLTLANADGAVDQVMVDGYDARVSYCRSPDGTGPWFECNQTFGSANEVSDTECGNGVIEGDEECEGRDFGGATCESLDLGYTGGTLMCSGACNIQADGCTTTSDLVINELNATDDDIEIYNGGTEDFDLGGLVLTDNDFDALYDPLLDDEALVFPSPTILEPDMYLVIPVGVGPGQHPFGISQDGDTVTLANADTDTVIDQVTFGSGEAITSFCRQPNGPGGVWMTCADNTIGSTNDL
jgi:hypothetical protein